MKTSVNDDLPRLQKVLAQAGVASRRASEDLILAGRVSVNGRVVTEMGSRVDPVNDIVRVDRMIVQLDTEKKYYVLNKPTGVISSMSDEKGRKDLSFYVRDLAPGVVNVGRLDRDTSGLLILTNDGDLSNRLAHPKYKVQKTYVARVEGRITPREIQKLRDGVALEDGVAKADVAKILQVGEATSGSLVEITLHSGKNRVVRRMLEAVGHPVTELVRRQFGPLHLGSLKHGQLRELSRGELGALLTASSADDAKIIVRSGRPGDGVGAKIIDKNAGKKPKGGKKRGR